PKVRDEPVVAGHEFKQLTACRNILIFETQSLSRLCWTESGRNDFIIDLGQVRAASREKPGDHRKAVSNRLGSRWPQSKRRDIPRQTIMADRVHVLVLDRPDLVREMLFD